ncbi:MAG: phage holin family protein [Dehalococcoidia bacterium]|nr:phage holin family protein [Dehalococcoidia bacterium]
MGILISFLINAVALIVASYVVPVLCQAPSISAYCEHGPGIHFTNLPAVAGAAIVFGLVNAFIKPLVSCVTCLIQAATLGLFTFVINALMLLLTSLGSRQLGFGFYVDGFLPALFGAIIISIVSMVLTMVQRRSERS